MNMNGILSPACVGMLAVAFGISFAHASSESGQVEPMSSRVKQPQVTRSENGKEARLAKLLKEASFSPGVAAVAKMARSGTDTSILIAHVQASDIAYKLRPEDIVHLNENDVPDSVIASMIVRGAEVRAQTPPLPQPVQQVQAPSPSASATVVFVPAPQPVFRAPASTVTVIGGSHASRGLSYRSHYYSARNFYSGTYGRTYASYGSYSYYGPSYRWGSSYRRGHGLRVCR